MKYVPTFEEFINESKKTHYEILAMITNLQNNKDLTRIFRGYPITFKGGEADGRDYNAYIELTTYNMDDESIESTIRASRRVKLPGISSKNIHTAPNFGGGVTMVIKYFDEQLSEK